MKKLLNSFRTHFGNKIITVFFSGVKIFFFGKELFFNKLSGIARVKNNILCKIKNFFKTLL